MPKKKNISEKVKSSESLGGGEGYSTAIFRSLDQPLAYAYVATCLHIIAYGEISQDHIYFPVSIRYGKPGVEECIITIKNCIKEGRLDLIEKAARLLQGDKKLIALISLRDTIDRCVEVPFDEEGRGSDPILPTKAAVREVFELMFPDLKEHFPTSKRQQAEWWAEVGYETLPQDRGAKDPPNVKMWLRE